MNIRYLPLSVLLLSLLLFGCTVIAAKPTPEEAAGQMFPPPDQVRQVYAVKPVAGGAVVVFQRPEVPPNDPDEITVGYALASGLLERAREECPVSGGMEGWSMEVIGIDWALLVTQIINVLILVGWIVLAIVALRRLRRPELDHFERVLWTLVILVLPLMGILTFFMARSGVRWTLLVTQVVNFLLILAGWLVLAILALVRLRRRQLDDVARVLWVLVILVIPIMGAVAFFIVDPGESKPDDGG